MPTPITFTAEENRMLQSQFRTMYEDDSIRSIEGPIILSILQKIEAYPTVPVFTEQEERLIQYQMEQFIEILKPYLYPFTYPTVPVIGQESVQLQLVESVLAKIEASWAQ